MKNILITGATSKFTEPLVKLVSNKFENIYLLSKTSELIYSRNNIHCFNFDLADSHEIPVVTKKITFLSAFLYSHKSDKYYEEHKESKLCQKCFQLP